MLSPVFAFASFGTNLKYGAKGSAVTELQEFLAEQGVYSGQITGNFFSLTLSAVKRFQTAKSLPPTGYFGPMSRTVANKLLAIATADSDVAETQETGSVNEAPQPPSLEANRPSCGAIPVGFSRRRVRCG